MTWTLAGSVDPKSTARYCCTCTTICKNHLRVQLLQKLLFNILVIVLGVCTRGSNLIIRSAYYSSIYSINTTVIKGEMVSRH